MPKLKELILRPNPNFQEFAFFGLGKNRNIDQLIVRDKYLLMNNQEDTPEGFPLAYIQKEELAQLFSLLIKMNRVDELMIFGHSHPSGTKLTKTMEYYVEPGEYLLEPSMGHPEDGGPTSGYDLWFYKTLFESGLNVPYAGIAAITKSGPKLKVYEIDKLVKIKRYNDIDRVPQITINL